MTLELIVRSYEPTIRNDRASQELRAYVRSEWRGDAAWLRREPKRVSLRSRLRGWLAARSPAVSLQSPATDPGASEEPAAYAVPTGLVEPCPHPDARELGISGGVVFLQCTLCGDVLVVDQDREWTLSAAPSEAPEHLCEA